MKNNKGFTLVELVIAVAIFSVVSTVVLGFTVTATNTYKGISTEVGLQFESQMMMGQLEEYMMDCNGGISFKDNTIAIVNREKDNQITAHYFRLDKEKKELWYSTSNVTKDIGGTIHYETPTTGLKEYLAASSVSDFGVVLKTNLQEYTTAKVTLSFEKGSRTYRGEQSIFMRNKVKTSTDLGTLMQLVCADA